MFEKEGIRYALEETIGTECLSMPIEDFHFIDLSDELQEKAQCWKDGAEFGYNKANEWHKGSKHPNHNHEVLCILWGTTKEVGYYENNVWYFESFTADDDDVDYWKEIVLPKESD